MPVTSRRHGLQEKAQRLVISRCCIWEAQVGFSVLSMEGQVTTVVSVRNRPVAVPGVVVLALTTDVASTLRAPTYVTGKGCCQTTDKAGQRRIVFVGRESPTGVSEATTAEGIGLAVVPSLLWATGKRRI